MPEVKITERFLDRLRPGGKRVEYMDAGSVLTNLRLGLRVGGRSLTWFVRYEVQGRRRRKNIGHYPTISREEARSTALRLHALVERGVDPQEHRAPSTIAEYWSRFVEWAQEPRPKSDGTLLPRIRTWQEYDRIGQKDFLPHFGKKRPGEVSRSDVRRRLREVHQRGEYIRNRTQAVISSFFKWLVQEELLESSPVEGIEYEGAEHEDERVLSWEEIRILWEVWKQDEALEAHVPQLLLVLGARPNEVVGIEPLIDFDDEGWWDLRDSKTKSHKHRLWIGTRLCQSILEELDLESDLLFPSPVKPSRPVSPKLRRHVLRWREASGIEDFELKHLRGTFAVRSLDIGLTPLDVAMVLNHSLPGIARVTQTNYLNRSYDTPRRIAFGRWAEALERCLRGESMESDEVAHG